MKITMAQLNPIVGDMDGNVAKAVQALSWSSQDQPDLVVLPELFIVGYPPQDYVQREWFVAKGQEALSELMNISKIYPDTGILVGSVQPVGQSPGPGPGIYNSAVLIHQGEIVFEQAKSLLPTYDVFDEDRYFRPAEEIEPFEFKGEKLGISICEDLWNDPELWPIGRTYTFDPIQILADKGATVLVNISASPFQVGKEETRYQVIRKHALKHKLPFVYVNQVGANDELIFDGRSFCLDRNGKALTVFPSCCEHIETVDLSLPPEGPDFQPLSVMESLYRALVLGTRDYILKCGFSSALVGLSGGIDSAVTFCLAVAALGKDNVLGISMPSPYSSEGSVEDSRKLAANLETAFKVIPITGMFESYLENLKEHFQGRKPDITEENIQARIRGNILMAMSNKFGSLVLTTGNKSESAMGYCTLYGDMAGGLAVIADVPKTMVYELAGYINRDSEIIPRAIIDKAPSAELRPNQKDEDSLPPYDLLDQILYYYIEQGRSPGQIVAQGFDAELVKWIVRAVNQNEYKRRQAAPALKVTSKAFGIGRKMPMAAKHNLWQ